MTPNKKLDILGNKLATAALTTLIRLCPEIRTANNELIEAALAAMRAKVSDALDELLSDAKAVPWMSEVVFASAVLTLAHEGIKVIRKV